MVSKPHFLNNIDLHYTNVFDLEMSTILSIVRFQKRI